MAARLSKLFDDISVDETKSARVTPVGVHNTLIVHAHDSVTAGVVVLEGSALATMPNDPEEWEVLVTETLTADGTFHQVVPTGAYRHLRVRVDTAIVGGSVDVWILTAPPGFGAISEVDLTGKAAV